MSTAKLENKRAAVLGQCTRARRIPALLPSPLGNPSQSPHWEAFSRWRSSGTSPAASILARSCSLWLSPCSPRVPGVPCAALPAGAGGERGSSSRKGLICTVWFGYLNTAVSVGVILGMFILCSGRDSRHM